MKWFKHFSDAYSNIKMQRVIVENGTECYGFFWICCELVAQQGQNFRIKGEKNWKKVLSHISCLKEEVTEKYLMIFAEANLIDKKALEMGDLYLPKMKEYSDEYTDKVRRMSRQYRDNVGLEEEQKKNRKEQKKNIYTDQFNSFWIIYPKHVGKNKSAELWEKLSEPDKKKALEDIPKRKSDGKWANGYIKDPERYIKNKQWEDDIIPQKVEQERKVHKFVKT